MVVPSVSEGGRGGGDCVAKSVSRREMVVSLFLSVVLLYLDGFICDKKRGAELCIHVAVLVLVVAMVVVVVVVVVVVAVAVVVISADRL